MVWLPQTDIGYAMQEEIDALIAERDRLKEEVERIRAKAFAASIAAGQEREKLVERVRASEET
jgi:hypothetical protein